MIVVTEVDVTIVVDVHVEGLEDAEVITDGVLDDAESIDVPPVCVEASLTMTNRASRAAGIISQPILLFLDEIEVATALPLVAGEGSSGG